MSWLNSPQDFKARMQIEWRQILTSSWQSPVRDCMSFHLQLNEPNSFDASVGAMLSVPVWSSRGWDSEKRWDGRSRAVGWDGCKASSSALRSRKHSQRWRCLGPEAQMFHSPSTCARVFRCKRMHVHVDTQTHSWAEQPALKVQTSYWAALQSAGLMKRYHVLHYSSMWGSGD